MQKQQSKPKPANSTHKARKLRMPRRVSFRLRKQVKRAVKPVPSAYKIFVASLRVLKKYWRSFLGIAAVYLVLSLILVRGFASTDLPALKELVSESLQGKGGDLTVGFTVFGLLLGTTNQATTQAGATYQFLLLIGVSLVVIWALRQAHAGIAFGVKEAFYKAFYPFVQFLGVLLVIGVQLLPFLGASILYNVVLLGGVAQSLTEQIVSAGVIMLLVIWSLYMLTSSIIALYIVTLPDMVPLRALRSARELVRHRRWTVLRKMLFLPFIIVVIGVAIMLPAILFLTPVAEWIFVGLTTISLLVVHSYMYSLYRELL